MKQLKYIALALLLLCGSLFAADEISVPYISGETLYMTRFDLDGDVYLSNGLSKEPWGTGGRGADDYDIPMVEKKTGAGTSFYYVGDFDAANNIGAGKYRVFVFVQNGGSPTDTDGPPLWHTLDGINWSGTAEIPFALQTDVTGAHSTTDALITTVDTVVDAIKAVTDLLPDGGALTSLATLANQTWLINFSEGDTWTNTATVPFRMEIRLKGTDTTITEKELFEIDGDDIIAETQRIGQQTELSP